MSQTLLSVRQLVDKGKLRISEHGYNELAADGLFAGEIIDGITKAEVVEDYPDYAKGPCVLVLQKNPEGSPVHVL
jgi:hypothetical protein